ncbi:MAG: hypothetical protein ACOYKN_06400 [Pirellula sp.]
MRFKQAAEPRCGLGSIAFQPGTQSWFIAIFVTVFFCGLLAKSICAQDPPSSGPASGMMPPENLPRVVGPGVLPDLMYMRNDKGEEILVPRTRYEDFERLLMETDLGGEGLAATPSLTQLDLVIEPVSDYAKVQLRGLIAMKKSNRTTWTVPIALSQLQWIPSQSSAEVQADGVESIATAAQSNGYLWRLGPSKSLQRRLELAAVCKLVTSASGTSLRLDLPPAATVIKLRLPKGDWELSATGGGNEVIEPFQVQGEYSAATVRTSSNSINMTWTRKATREAIAAIEVRSQTKYSPSGDANRWRADTALSIRGPIKLGGKRILWNLPPQGLVREANSSVINFANYRLVRDKRPNSGAGTNETDSTTAVLDPATLTQEKPSENWWIEIDEAYSRTELDLNLEWQLSRSPGDPQVRFEAPYLEGVERHGGTIEFAIPRTNSIDWSPTGAIQLSRQSQAADGSESIVYSFQFDGQPAKIATQWTTVAQRPRMLSEQRVEIRENRILLRGAIEFGSDPIQLPLLELEVEGWKPERIVLYPSEVDVPLDSVPSVGQPTVENPESVWSLPINANLWIRSATSARPTQSESVRSERSTEVGLGGLGLGNPFEIIANPTERKEAIQAWRLEYLLSRQLPAQSNEIAFSLPRLSWLSQETQQRIVRTPPGRMLLYSWPYRLISSSTDLSGIVETSLDRTFQKQLIANNFGATPFLMQYGIADGSSACRWTGQRTRKGSFVSASLIASVSPTKDTIEWDLRWDCKCLGSRPTELLLGFPIESIGSNPEQSGRELSVSIDNRPVAIEWIADDSSQSKGMRLAKLIVPEVAVDGSNRLDFLIEAKYATAHRSLDKPGDQVLVDLGVARLTSAREMEQLHIEQAELRIQSTSSFSLSLPTGTNTGSYEIDPNDPRISTIAMRRANEVKSSLRLDGEWVQTIVNAIEQRDRYVARFQTDQRMLRIATTPELIGDAEWMIDGQRAVVREDSESKGYAIVAIPEEGDSTNSDTHVLEVFATQAAPKGWFRKVQPIGPRLSRNPSSAPMVWQIIVPRTEHLVASTKNTLPMYQWRWSDLFFRRVGTTDQQQLEERFGATRQPVLAQQVNQYDLTSIASTQPLEATFVPSALIWLPVSLIVLLLAVVLKDNRWIRWPWFWALFLGSFFIFSQIAWDVSLLVLQAAVVSVALAVLYALARWVMDRRARRRSIFVTRQYSPTTISPKSMAGANIAKKSAGDSSAFQSTVTANVREPQ